MKKLSAGNLFWNQTIEPFACFNPLQNDLETDVLIIGGGMSGNLCAHEIAGRNHSVVVCEKDQLAMGSSSASSGILQYLNDEMLYRLIESIGEKKAVLFYQMCLDSMKDLINLSRKMEQYGGLIPRKGVFFASAKEDVPELDKEYKALSDHYFPVSYLDHAELMQIYGIDRPAALETSMNAEVNPYQFLQTLIKLNGSLGVQYYEKTGIKKVKTDKDQIIATTKNGNRIQAKYVVFATGCSVIYPELKKKMKVVNTYTFASSVSKRPLWQDHALFRETQPPYLFFRMTEDNRVIAGETDKKADSPEKKKGAIDKRNREILERVQSLMPNLDVKVEYSWNTLSADSKDHIPFIGPSKKDPRRIYLIGVGGNGLVHSMAGASIIADYIDGIKNPYAGVVKAKRK